VQELNVLSTGMLNSVQRLFSHHMIETFGCDYSTSGVTLEALQAKLKAFLELRTADGPRHDTYVVFYSGHTQRTGAWALAGECHHSLQGLGWLAGCLSSTHKLLASVSHLLSMFILHLFISRLDQT
jgi:hypothetical protein